MESITLSIEHSSGTWFGCLVDDNDRLVAAAFGADPKQIQKHLSSYSKRTCGLSAEIERHALARDMIRLFEGDKPSEPLHFNDDFTSPFQRKVIQLMRQIPSGRVTTYGLIAKSIGSAPRAVGGAVGSNPWPIFVPCHRVVNGDMSIGNYGMCGRLGKLGTVTKKDLLDRERVSIQGDRVDRSALWVPPVKKKS